MTRILLLHFDCMLFVCLIPSYTVSKTTQTWFVMILIIFGINVIERVNKKAKA